MVESLPQWVRTQLQYGRDSALELAVRLGMRLVQASILESCTNAVQGMRPETYRSSKRRLKAVAKYTRGDRTWYKAKCSCAAGGLTITKNVFAIELFLRFSWAVSLTLLFCLAT